MYIKSFSSYKILRFISYFHFRMRKLRLKIRKLVVNRAHVKWFQSCLLLLKFTGHWNINWKLQTAEERIRNGKMGVQMFHRLPRGGKQHLNQSSLCYDLLSRTRWWVSWGICVNLTLLDNHATRRGEVYPVAPISHRLKIAPQAVMPYTSRCNRKPGDGV